MQRATWKRVHGELTRLARSKSAYDAEEAQWLLEGVRVRVHEPLGYGSFASYLEHVFGYGPRLASERLRVAEAIAALPAMRDALASDELCWSAVRELTRVAVAETEAEWIAAARGRAMREVEEMVSGRRRGDRPGDRVDTAAKRHVLRLEVSADALAAFREARRRIELDVGHSLDDDEAVRMAGPLRARRSGRSWTGRLSGGGDRLRALPPGHPRRSRPRAARRAAGDRGRAVRRAAHRQHPRGRRARQGDADHPAAHPPPRVPPRARPLPGALLPRGSISGNPPHRSSSRRRHARPIAACLALLGPSHAGPSRSAARQRHGARSPRVSASPRDSAHGVRLRRNPRAITAAHAGRPPRRRTRRAAAPRLLRGRSAPGPGGLVGCRRPRDAPAPGPRDLATAGPRLARVRADSALRRAASRRPSSFRISDREGAAPRIRRRSRGGESLRRSVACDEPRAYLTSCRRPMGSCPSAPRPVELALWLAGTLRGPGTWARRPLCCYTASWSPHVGGHDGDDGAGRARRRHFLARPCGG